MQLRLSALFLAVAFLAPPAADAAVPDTRIQSMGASSPLIGMADNTPEMLGDPTFWGSGIKRVRKTVPYDDVARGGIRRRALDEWFANARSQDIEPLVSFYRTYSCSAKCAIKRLPTVSQYRAHVRKFRKRYPWVRHFSTWNEINFEKAQPTGRDPKRAAQFYKVLRSECRGCTVLTGDFRSDGRPQSSAWLKTFKRHIGGGSHRWGLVSHTDINRLTTKDTRWFLKRTRGPVWGTEVGAINFFRGVFNPSINRQTRAMRFLVGKWPRTSRRIQRVYVYHWRAARGNRLWDSALFNANGGRRPAASVFFSAIGRPLP